MSGCETCRLLASPGALAYQEPAFAVVRLPEGACAGYDLALVPRAHISSIADLAAADMAAVLAGLTRLGHGVQRAYGPGETEVVVHPGEHVHFHVVSRMIDLTEHAGERTDVIVEALAR